MAGQGWGVRKSSAIFGWTQKRHTTKVLLSVFTVIQGVHMTAATKVLPVIAAKTETTITIDFISVALFSGVGLLLSLAVVILDQLSPAVEWF